MCIGTVAPGSSYSTARAQCGDHGRRSRGIARNETARKQNTSASAFQAKGDLRLACRYLLGLVSDGASASALHRQDGNGISQLPGFRINAASLPLPSARATPEYRDPDLCRWASSLRAVICHRLLPSVLPLKPSGCVSGRPWKLNVNVFKPFGFTDGSRKLCAVRSKPFTASFRTLLLPSPPAAPFNTADTGLGGLVT